MVAMELRESATTEGKTTLEDWTTEYIFTHNAVVGRSSSFYPANNFFPNSVAVVKFLDTINHDYRLAAGSPLKSAANDGTDAGANIDLLLQAINGVVSGGLGLQSMGQDSGSGTMAPSAAIIDASISRFSRPSVRSEFESPSNETLVKSSDVLLVDYAFGPSLSFDDSTEGNGWSALIFIEDEDAEDDKDALDQMFGTLDGNIELVLRNLAARFSLGIGYL